MDDRRRTPSDGKSSHCFWQGELKNGKVSILLICGKHLHHITSLRGEVWAHRTSLIPPLYIEVPVLSLESEGVYVHVLEVLILSMFVQFFDYIWELF